jgi:excisionase family DNA binding protein
MSTLIALNVPEAATAANVGPTKIRQEIKAGRLRARKAGKLLLIAVDDLKSWLDALPPVKAVVS